MKPKSKLLSLLLAICLVVGLMPTSALAAGPDTEKAIQLVDSGTAANIDGYDSTDGYDYIYYGTWNDSAIKWRVLDDQTNTGENGLFLLSEELLGTGNYGGVYFQQSYHYDSSSGSHHKGSAPANGDHTDCLIANAWQGSDAQTWCTTFYSSNFSTGEQGAVIETTKSDTAFISSTYSYSFAASENILNGDKVFFLSAQEAENSEYGFTNDAARIANYGGGAGVWWLRSPFATRSAGAVVDLGSVDSYYVGNVWAARPAFNLDLTSVLFTSAAVGGKIPAASSGGNQGGEAADAIFEIGDYDGSEWKLTLLDKSRNFAISNATINGSGDTVVFSYSSAQTGTNEYISVVIENNGAITHYGRILQLDGTTNGESGTASLTLPAGVTLSENTKLYVFNEQYNGGENDDTKLTDYASQLIEVNPAIDDTAPTLTAGNVSRDSATEATVKFISDEAGSYYYTVVESGVAEPSIDTTEAGISCDTTEQTISLTSLSGAGAKDIYIVAKDAVGNVSQQLKITIPAYIAPVYGISASPAALNFGSETEGYADAPAAQTVTIKNMGNQSVTVNLPTNAKYTITAGTGFENGDATLASDGTATFTVQPNTGLDAGSHDDTLNISGIADNGATESASVKLSFTVNAVYTLTVNLNGGSGNTTGGEYAENADVNIDAGSRSNYRFTGWTTSNGGSFADASSASTTFSMPAADTTITANWTYSGGGGAIRPSTPGTPTGPATSENGGWEKIGNEIEEAQPGETIVVDMNGTTEVPAEIFEKMAGKDVTVAFDLGDGISWTVNGQDVPTGTSFQNLNLGVEMGTSGISADVINDITGEHGSVQVALAHDGEFGFAITLTAPLGSDNAGYWANLYYYHEDSETLTFQTSGRIEEDGSVSLRFNHASQYAIVIDDYSHAALPFADVPEGAWYHDAVSYVYTNGLMVGTGDATFSPEISTSRAMIAVTLWRMEGAPAAKGANPFTDVENGAWYTEAITWANENGIAEGYGNGCFQPETPVTREQLASFFYRYAEYKGYDITITGSLDRFNDKDNVSEWAKDTMAWAVGYGLIGGKGNNMLDPQGEATRAEFAAMLQRFCQKG